MSLAGSRPLSSCRHAATIYDPGNAITCSALPDNYMKVTVTGYAGLSCRYILLPVAAPQACVRYPKDRPTQPGYSDYRQQINRWRHWLRGVPPTSCGATLTRHEDMHQALAVATRRAFHLICHQSMTVHRLLLSIIFQQKTSIEGAAFVHLAALPQWPIANSPSSFARVYSQFLAAEPAHGHRHRSGRSLLAIKEEGTLARRA